jgi:amylosucrase
MRTAASRGAAPRSPEEAAPAGGTGEVWLERAVALAREALAGGLPSEREAFVLRLRRHWTDLWEGLEDPYGKDSRFAASLERLVRVLAARWAERPDHLRALDLQRAFHPDWFQAPEIVGYVFYVDRFAGTIRGVEEHLDYLEELGVRYVHLMPLLQTRPGDNDGGYAVADYRAVEPGLGSMTDLQRLCRLMRDRGMSVCIDLVLNHCAAEHEWAVRARAGDREYEELFWIFPNRRMPNRFEKTLPEVFPDFAPGNFSRLPDGRWVWTTFNAFQWDLNWSNPRVFLEIVDILLDLANRGVDVFRLDAVAFMWKRLGTNCQNQPEVHSLLRALRACARIAAPAVIFKAEAIVGPDDLAPYLGVGRNHGRECDLAYHNSLMVQYWSALATRDTRLMTHVLSAFPRKPATTSWATYIRCHDDIGWAVTEADAEAVGWTGPEHRAFLSSFYAGDFPGSFAVGEVFQHNPATGDSRISGTFASLAGLERALAAGDPGAVDLAVARMLLGHAMIMGWDGLPLLYMGDEIAILNDRSYRDDPSRASDSRWIHRPRMDWARAAERGGDGPVGRVFRGTRHLVRVRRSLPALHAATPLEVLDLGNPALFAFVRAHPSGPLLAVHNLTETAAAVEGRVLEMVGLDVARDAISGEGPFTWGRPVPLTPYAVRWLVAAVGSLPGGSAVDWTASRANP